MTVGIAVKVHDGIVLATDSATSIALPGGGHQVYNNANKIFQLHRHLPLAAMTWGLGNIGSASIATLAKDLRRRFMGKDLSCKDWKLNSKLTVEDVAKRLVEMIHPLYAAEHTGAVNPPYLGFLVVGYSGSERAAEAWQLDFSDASIPPTPEPTIKRDDSGWASYAQPEATTRLFRGFDPELPGLIKNVLAAADWANVEPFFSQTSSLMRTPTHAAMPLGDAIALAKYLAEVTAGYSHFLPGADTVGGAVEVAALSRHEGFKWVARKHYFSSDLNPEESSHAY